MMLGGLIVLADREPVELVFQTPETRGAATAGHHKSALRSGGLIEAQTPSALMNSPF